MHSITITYGSREVGAISQRIHRLAQETSIHTDHVQFRYQQPCGFITNHCTGTIYHHYINNRSRCHQNLTYQGAWPCTRSSTNLQMQARSTLGPEKSRGGQKIFPKAALFHTIGSGRYLLGDSGHGISGWRQRNVEKRRWFPRYVLTTMITLHVLLSVVALPESQ